MSKSGFSYPDRILVGIQGKSGESWWDQDGWTVWKWKYYLIFLLILETSAEALVSLKGKAVMHIIF